MEDDVLAEARSFFNAIREATNQGLDLALAKILAAGSKHVSLVNAHLAKNGLRPESDLFRLGSVLIWRREVEGWQDAVDEVVANGLDPGIVSLEYWQQHFELPHVFVKARKFFEIIDNMTVDQERSRIARAADTRASRAKTALGSVASNVSARTGSRGTCTRARARTRTGKNSFEMISHT